MLLRRLRLPLPLAPRRCSCGGGLDVYGDHRSACAQVGVLAKRAGPLEQAAARICREAGARVAAHVALRDLNLDVPAADGRRVEVVANGLPIWQGAQIAVDATIVSPIRRDGQPRPRADREPGLALNQAVDRKHRTYPEFQQARRCRLVVVGVEVGGRISRPTLTFLRLLARARARQRAPWCAAGARQALMRRWTALEAVFWASVPFLMASVSFLRGSKTSGACDCIFGELENDRAHTHICLYVYTYIHTNVATSISFFVRSQGL